MPDFKKHILVVGLLLNSISYSQISRELLMEDSIHNFETSYNLPQRLIDSTFLSTTSASNQELFKLFMRERQHLMYKANFQLLFNGTINAADLQNIYEDEFNSLKINTTLITNFNNWKAGRIDNIPVNTNTPESGGCGNVNFELGNWSSWEPSRADVNWGITTHPQYGVKNVTSGASGKLNRASHLMVTGGYDPNAPALPRLNPKGGNYSIRLGDVHDYYGVSILKHKVKITTDKPYFTYDFAVVLEDPAGGHTNLEVPFFTVNFTDSNDVKINTCGNYDVTSSTTSFINVGNGGWKYKPWARISIDLAAYIGQEITVTFIAADCSQGAHEGRAYIDGSCLNPDITKDQDCKGIKLSVDSGYQKYQWFDSIPFKLIPGATNKDYYIPGPGKYRVRIISESGCTLFIDTLINDICIILKQNITHKKPSCVGINDGEITLNAIGGKPPYTYSINNGASVVSINTFTGLAPGTYICTVYDSSGCFVTDTFNLNNPSPIYPNLKIKNNTCFGECSGEVEAFPSNGNYTIGSYQVEFDNVLAPSKKRNNLCAGIHSVKITDNKGCSINSTFNITDPPIETIDFVKVNDEKCYNDCSGSIVITDANATEYSIDNGLTFQSSNSFSNLCAQAGPYHVAIKTGIGCIVKSTKNMNQPSLLSIHPISDTFVCLNIPVSFTGIACGGTPPYTTIWSNGTSGVSMTESPKTPSIYTVTITDDNGCNISDEFSIGLHPQPKANFQTDPGPTTDIYNVKVNFTNTTSYNKPLTYNWEIDDYGTFNTKDAYMEFPELSGETFTNCLTVENEQGCRDSICKDIYIKNELLVYVPNTFTPNEDNINDVFTPYLEGLKEEGYQFLIYNRWGELLFYTNNKTEGWNGKHNGKLVKEDSYVWRINGITKEENDEFKKIGHVIMLKK